MSKEERFEHAFSSVFKNTGIKNPNVQGKSVMEQEYGFTIDSLCINEFLTDGYVSYTFLIHRETVDSTFFENLVVEIDSTEKANAYLVKYTPKSGPTYHPLHDSFSMDSSVDVVKIDYNPSESRTTVCITVTTVYCNCCGSDGTQHVAGPNCTASYMYTESSTNCYSVGGNGGGDDDTGSDPPGDEGGGGDGTGGENNNNDPPSNDSGHTNSPTVIVPVSPDEGPEEPEDKPCPGDAVKNPEIAPQHGSSGAKGALFGCTRYGNDGCSGDGNRNEKHNGIDIKSEYGNPLYAMFGGTVHSSYYQPNGAGYVTRIRSELSNGEIIIYQYFHMQEDGRLTTLGATVEAGDIIGYQGTSGNLGPAIASGGVDSHVHIKIGLYDGTGDSSNYSNFKNNTVDPANYMHTTFDENGNSVLTDCN